jgi:hypothetical protein
MLRILVGGRYRATKLIAETREQALDRRLRAQTRGADAVVAFRFDRGRRQGCGRGRGVYTAVRLNVRGDRFSASLCPSCDVFWAAEPRPKAKTKDISGEDTKVTLKISGGPTEGQAEGMVHRLDKDASQNQDENEVAGEARDENRGNNGPWPEADRGRGGDRSARTGWRGAALTRLVPVSEGSHERAITRGSGERSSFWRPTSGSGRTSGRQPRRG